MAPYCSDKAPTGFQKVTFPKIKQKTDSFKNPQIVCLELDQTLLAVFSEEEYKALPNSWAIRALPIKTMPDKTYVILRQGANELLQLLDEYAITKIYSRLTFQAVEAITLGLSSHEAQIELSALESNESITEKPHPYEDASWIWMHLQIWGFEQCLENSQGVQKSLGHFCEHTDTQINNVWLLDTNQNNADFPSHVITVPPFSGDPSDTALFQLIERLFTE